MDGFEELSTPAPRSVTAAGVEIGRGSRVVLRPGEGGDIFDRALAGQLALVEAIHEDTEGKVDLAVTLDDDPGRDLGAKRQPGHRFFFSPAEVEPLAGAAEGLPAVRVLVAGIGNVFLADDGFGVEVARLLGQRELPAGVKVADFGIRGMDLAYELQEDYDAAILVDAVPRGGEPGTLYVIEPDAAQAEGMLDAHSMDPVRVLGLAKVLGSVPPRVLVVGCEPAVHMTQDDEELLVELSPAVKAATLEAVALVESVLADLLQAGKHPTKEGTS